MDDTNRVASSLDELRSRARAGQRDQLLARLAQLRDYAELGRRGMQPFGLRCLADLIQIDLRCSRREARDMASDIDRFIERTNLIGEPLEPEFAAVGRALSQAAISLVHARVIADTIDRLSNPLRAEQGVKIEAILVEYARDLNPNELVTAAKRIVCHLDQDGPEPAEDIQHRQRAFHLLRNHDGTGSVRGTLTATCLAALDAALAPLAAQRQPDELGEDKRTRGQRYHDGLEELGRRALESGSLPSHAGLPAELLVTIDLHDLESRVGQATTHHGGTLTVQQALHLAAELNVIPVVLDQELGLVQHGRGRRLADQYQRKVVFARDRGCTFPGCAKSAAESEVHHMLDWLFFGDTNIENLTITCAYHNNEAPRQGWQAVMIDGFPHWKPPRWQDPDQQPKRTLIHHPELLLRT